MQLVLFILIGGVCSLITRWTTGFLVGYLRDKALVDKPNERSNHTVATPRGGGLAIVDMVFTGWLVGLFFIDQLSGYWPLIFAFLFIAAVSYLDDRYNLSAPLRLCFQAVAVAGTLLFLHPGDLLFHGHLPLWLDKTLTALLWLWFINLFNFMDGIDGITGAETLHLSLGLILAGVLLAAPLTSLFLLTLVAGSMIGFLFHNWHPSKIFLGDVGSVPLGFLLGYFLLHLSYSGFWMLALILPAYYWFDSSFTLVKRLAQGKKIWQAHSEHFYQQAVRAGWRHDTVVYHIALVNALLLLLSVFYLQGELPLELTLSLALLPVLLLCVRFATLGKAA